MELAKLIRQARRVYLCGNGGSAANAIHIANDLISCGIRAHALTADVATLTAIANDYSYAEVFAQQLLVFAEPGDLLIALSGSGNSENIIRAIYVAKFHGMTTVGIFGAYNDHSEFSSCEHIIQLGDDMQAAENAQLALGHDAMRWLKQHERLHPDIDIIGTATAYQQ